MPERPNPFRVSITGIDGAGKDTVTMNALTRLSDDGLNITKMNRPFYRLEDGSLTEIFPKFKSVLDVVHRYSDRSRARTLIGGINTLNTLIQSRVLEPRALSLYPDTDVLASARDLRIDPAVYSSFYFPNLKSATKTAELTERMTRFTGIKRDMVVWLQVDPNMAVERIEGRIEREVKEREANGGHISGMREKWRHMHEDPDSLAELAARYDIAIKRLVEIRPLTEVVTIETTDLPADEVGKMVYHSISRVMAARMTYDEAPDTIPATAA